MEIGSDTGKAKQNLSILNSYDPHMGYAIEQIDEYWETLSQHIQSIPNTNIKMRCAGNNGQISQDTRGNTKFIGKWTISNNAEKGNGGNLVATCRGARLSSR